MPTYPQQTFPSFAALATYINTQWVTNGKGDITGVVGNNVVNALLTFIQQSPLNWNKASVVTAGGGVTAGSQQTPGPIMIFTNSTPSSLEWTDNIYNEYVFINYTGNAIPLANGFTYFDNTVTAQSAIPANQVVYIYKVPSGDWFLGNNLSSTGNVPGGGLNGQIIGANSAGLPVWTTRYIKLPVAGFTNPTQYQNANLSGMYYDLFVNDINRYLAGPDDPNSEWQYIVSGGFNVGFQITIPSFNLQTLAYPIYLWPKPQPA